MKLESALKHFNPRGTHVTDTSKCTSSERITGADVMAAMGCTNKQARFGLAAFLGKAGISKTDGQLAVQALARHALDVAPKSVRKAAGDKFGWCMQVLAQYAFAEYSRSAESSVPCQPCSGRGVISQYESVIKHPGIFNSQGMEIVPPKIKQEIVQRTCITCKGKGRLYARCRCGGKGEVIDRKATSERGTVVMKHCERCCGNGFSRIPSTAAYNVILKHVPDLHARTWTRSWKPLLGALVALCQGEELKADLIFKKVTDLRNDTDKI